MPIKINSYTTVKRRERVPHEVFATYWRDVHGPLCSRLPGLGLYIQHHFSRNQDAHLWPLADGVSEIVDYELDGGVEIGFLSADDQARFKATSPILFSDEQNMFAQTLAYDLPQGSVAVANHLNDETLNGPDDADRIHIHMSPRQTLQDLQAYVRDGLAQVLANDESIVKVRLHLCSPFENDGNHPPSPDVEHTATAPRVELVIMEVAFASPLARRRFFQSATFQNTLADQARYIAQLKAFAVQGVYTYVFEGQMTTAGLRGSRAAQLIEYLGAVNQLEPDVAALFRATAKSSSPAKVQPKDEDNVPLDPSDEAPLKE